MELGLIAEVRLDYLSLGLTLFGLGVAGAFFVATARQLTDEFGKLRTYLIAALLVFETQGWIELDRDEKTKGPLDPKGHLAGYQVPQRGTTPGRLVLRAKPNLRWWRVWPPSLVLSLLLAISLVLGGLVAIVFSLIL